MTPTRHPVVSALTVSAALTGTALAGDPPTIPNTEIMHDGATVAGWPDPVFGAPLSLVVGPEGWLMRLTMEGHIELIVSETGQLGLHEGQELPGGDVVDRFFLSFAADNGRIAQHLELDDGDQAIALDDSVVLREGEPVPGQAAGVDWEGFSSVDLVGDVLTVSGRAFLPGDPALVGPFLMRWDVNPGNTLSNPTALLAPGDLVAGAPLDSMNSSLFKVWDADSAGTVMAPLRLDAAGGATTTDVIALGDTILATDDAPSLIPGRDWIVALNDACALNDQGDHAYVTRVVGGLDGLRVLVKNGQVLAQQGQAAPGIPGGTIAHIIGPRLAEDGSVLWYADVEVGTAFGLDAFYIDDELVVLSDLSAVSTPTIIDGHPLLGVSTTSWTWDIAPDGRSMVFRGFHQFGGWGVYEVEVAPWLSQGGGLAGTGGSAPLATGTGSLAPGSSATVALGGGPAFGTTHLVLGLSELGAPFKGGTLCPAPDIVLPGLPLGAGGGVALAFTWPAAVPSGLELLWQFWTQDPGGPVGFSASNCLVATQP